MAYMFMLFLTTATMLMKQIGANITFYIEVSCSGNRGVPVNEPTQT